MPDALQTYKITISQEGRAVKEVEGVVLYALGFAVREQGFGTITNAAPDAASHLCDLLKMDAVMLPLLRLKNAQEVAARKNSASRIIRPGGLGPRLL